MRSWHASVVIGIALLFVSSAAGSTDATSGQYRLVGSGPASVTATASSPVYEVLLVGGAGAPVGISASPNVSVVTGGTSNELPTARIFRSGMEG